MTKSTNDPAQIQADAYERCFWRWMGQVQVVIRNKTRNQCYDIEREPKQSEIESMYQNNIDPIRAARAILHELEWD